MEIKKLQSWEEFEEIVKEGESESQLLKASGYTIGSTTPLLYRGQADAEWDLKSVLERENSQCSTVGSYFDLMLEVWYSKREYQKKWPSLVNEVTELNCGSISEFLTEKANSYETIGFMAQLRQYGFPSPLLDWTESPLIAAYFAFETIPLGTESVAIYTFIEQTGTGFSGFTEINKPILLDVGSYMPEIRRHCAQESHYTLCVQQDYGDDFKKAKFSKLDEDINRNDIDGVIGPVENVLKKYTIPVSERKKVLRKLQEKNINRSKLFGITEDNDLFDY